MVFSCRLRDSPFAWIGAAGIGVCRETDVGATGAASKQSERPVYINGCAPPGKRLRDHGFAKMKEPPGPRRL
jgi:hypothetical protein